jgi:glycopeptide antibiotics resistance protein
MKGSRANRVTIVLFIVYLVAVFWIIVLKLNVQFSNIGTRNINLIPYKAPLLLNATPDYGEMIMNVLIFVPLGLYAGILFKSWSFGKKVFLAFSVSFLCEVFQFILRIGLFDTTDLVNNTLGGIIGLIIYKGIEKAMGSSKAQKYINVFSLIGTFSVLLFLFLLKMEALWIFGINLRYQ